MEEHIALQNYTLIYRNNQGRVPFFFLGPSFFEVRDLRRRKISRYETIIGVYIPFSGCASLAGKEFEK